MGRSSGRVAPWTVGISVALLAAATGQTAEDSDLAATRTLARDCFGEAYAAWEMIDVAREVLEHGSEDAEVWGADPSDSLRIAYVSVSEAGRLWDRAGTLVHRLGRCFDEVSQKARPDAGAYEVATGLTREVNALGEIKEKARRAARSLLLRVRDYEGQGGRVEARERGSTLLEEMAGQEGVFDRVNLDPLELQATRLAEKTKP